MSDERMNRHPHGWRACRECAIKAGWKPRSGGTGTALECKCRYCGKAGRHMADSDYGFVFADCEMSTQPKDTR